jgi:hypothetical protein
LRFRTTVGVDGHVRSASPLQSSEYNADAKKLVDAMEFKPFVRNRRPVEAELDVYVFLFPPEKKPSVHVPFPEVTDWSKVEIEFRRGECFGSCPVYQVRISGEGSVDYKDRQPAMVVSGEEKPLFGELKGTIPRSEVEDLVEAFRGADFYSLDDQYKLGVTDMPTYVLTLRIGAAQKTVIDYVGGQVGMPHAVSEIEDRIDKLIEPIKAAAKSK